MLNHRRTLRLAVSNHDQLGRAETPRDGQATRPQAEVVEGEKGRGNLSGNTHQLPRPATLFHHITSSP